jgi:hypothetical protein
MLAVFPDRFSGLRIVITIFQGAFELCPILLVCVAAGFLLVFENRYEILAARVLEQDAIYLLLHFSPPPLTPGPGHLVGYPARSDSLRRAARPQLQHAKAQVRGGTLYNRGCCCGGEEEGAAKRGTITAASMQQGYAGCWIWTSEKNPPGLAALRH